MSIQQPTGFFRRKSYVEQTEITPEEQLKRLNQTVHTLQSDIASLEIRVRELETNSNRQREGKITEFTFIQENSYQESLAERISVIEKSLLRKENDQDKVSCCKFI